MLFRSVLIVAGLRRIIWRRRRGLEFSAWHVLQSKSQRRSDTISCSRKAVAGSVLTNSTAKQLPDQFDELDSEAVAGHDMLQLTSAVTDYLLILLLFQLYSCVCRSLRSSSSASFQPHTKSVRPHAFRLTSPSRRSLRTTADVYPASPYPTRHT